MIKIVPLILLKFLSTATKLQKLLILKITFSNSELLNKSLEKLLTRK